MTKNNKVGSALLVLAAGMIFNSTSQAADTDTIYIRATGGPSFYSNLEPVSSAIGVGLDLGFRSQSGFGLAAMTKLNFMADGRTEITTSDSSRTEIKALFFGVNPHYAVTKGIATLSFGLGVGALSVTDQVDYFTTPSSPSSPERTRTRFALAPNVGADFDIYSGIFGSVAFQYIATRGESPKPALISTMAGVGYRF